MRVDIEWTNSDGDSRMTPFVLNWPDGMELPREDDSIRLVAADQRRSYIVRGIRYEFEHGELAAVVLECD